MVVWVESPSVVAVSAPEVAASVCVGIASVTPVLLPVFSWAGATSVVAGFVLTSAVLVPVTVSEARAELSV